MVARKASLKLPFLKTSFDCENTSAAIHLNGTIKLSKLLVLTDDLAVYFEMARFKGASLTKMGLILVLRVVSNLKESEIKAEVKTTDF